MLKVLSPYRECYCLITASVSSLPQTVRLNIWTVSQVAAGSVQKAVIVETKKEFQRADGSCVRFDRNACVLVNPKGLPIGTRVLGFVTHELRARQLMKVRLSAVPHCCRSQVEVSTDVQLGGAYLN